MPTSFASNATAPRILSASVPRTASASGSDVFVKIGLQDELSGDGIARRLSGTGPDLRAAQSPRCVPGGEALIGEPNRQLEPSAQLLAEAAGVRRHRMRRSVGMAREPDQQQ